MFRLYCELKKRVGGDGESKDDPRPLREQFAESEELAGVMGITPEQFGRLSPPEFKTMYEAWKIREERTDRRIGRLCAIIANVNRDPKKRKEPFTEEDFIPKQRTKKKQTPEEMLNIVRALNQAFGGKGG